MPAYVAFLRAVNVGGRFVKMADLRAGLEEAGFTEVQTHIQSGNVRVTSARRSVATVRADLEKTLLDIAGFDIPAIVRTPKALRTTVARIDRAPAKLPGARRYVAFADDAITGDGATALEGWREPGERATVLGDTVLADLTVDFHKLKLSNARLERITGLTTTWRDLKVVRAIDEKWGS